jgi:putative membrane protein
MKFLLKWLISAAAIIITAYLLSAGVDVTNFGSALVLALVLGIINTLIRPIILLLTLPINIATLGLFTFIINALLIILADKIVPGFTVDNFWWALLFSLILSIINSVLQKGLTSQTPINRV